MIKVCRINYRLLNSTVNTYRESYKLAKAGPDLRVVSAQGKLDQAGTQILSFRSLKFH